MTEIKKERSSNFELLRIFAMMMIILYHIVCHCVSVQLTDGNSMNRMGNALFVQPYFSKKVLILVFLMTFGESANAIFILISGFFMAGRESEKINLEKISVKLLSQMMFACVALMVGSFGLHLVKKSSFLELVDCYFFNGSAWFIGYYFVIVLCGRIFLNKFLSKLDEKSYCAFLLSMAVLFSFGWPRGLLYNLANGLDVFCVGTFLYSLGGFIKKYNPFEKFKISFFVGVIIFIYLLLALSYYNQTETNIERYYRNGGSGWFIQSVPGFGNHHFIPVSLGICIFEIFRRIKIPSIKIINFLGASTLMIYLLHDIPFVYSIWNTQDWISVLFYHPIKFCGKILIWAIMTFAAGFIAYVIYDLMMTILKKCRFVFLKKEKSISLS